MAERKAAEHILHEARKEASRKGGSHIHSKADALRLRTKLAFEEAGILTADGKLTRQALREAELIDLKGNIKNPKIIEILTKDGSLITDWGKFKSQNMVLPNGQIRQIHFYKNKKTGKVDHETYDYKVKDEVRL